MQTDLAIHLDAFVAAADGASFSAAARRLGLTPAAVSKSWRGSRRAWARGCFSAAPAV